MLTNRFRLRLVTVTFLVTMCAGIGVWKFTPQILAGSVFETTGKRSLSARTTRDAEASKLPAGLQALHDRYVQAFVDSEGFGVSRLPRLDDPFHQTLDIAGHRFNVRSLELVSLQVHDVPVAYVNNFRNPVRNQYKLGKTRSLNDFEQRSLEKLRSGEQFQFNNDGEHPQFLGAIRARTACLDCHDAKVGDLLGAFAYHLTPAVVLSADHSVQSPTQAIESIPRVK